MQHKVKVTVIDKKLYPELQQKYCADPHSGACPCYNVGDEFIFERYGSADDFWHMGLNTLKRTDYPAENVAGGPAIPAPGCPEIPPLCADRRYPAPPPARPGSGRSCSSPRWEWHTAPRTGPDLYRSHQCIVCPW